MITETGRGLRPSDTASREKISIKPAHVSGDAVLHDAQFFTGIGWAIISTSETRSFVRQCGIDGSPTCDCDRAAWMASPADPLRGPGPLVGQERGHALSS